MNRSRRMLVLSAHLLPEHDANLYEAVSLKQVLLLVANMYSRFRFVYVLSYWCGMVTLVFLSRLYMNMDSISMREGPPGE